MALEQNPTKRHVKLAPARPAAKELIVATPDVSLCLVGPPAPARPPRQVDRQDDRPQVRVRL